MTMTFYFVSPEMKSSYPIKSRARSPHLEESYVHSMDRSCVVRVDSVVRKTKKCCNSQCLKINKTFHKNECVTKIILLYAKFIIYSCE